MNELNGRQLSIMLFFIPLVFKMSMLPSLMYQVAGADSYLAICAVCLLEFLQLGMVLFVCHHGGMEEIYIRYGGAVYLLLSLPLCAVMLLKSIVFLAEITNYVTSFLFYNILNFPISITTLIVLFYLGYKGGRSISRMFELTVWLIPLIVIMGFIFGKANLQFDYILPVGNVSAAISGIKKYLIYTFDFSPLLFFHIKVRKRKNVAIFSILSVFAVTACYMLLIARYGKATFLADCAFARLASFDTVVSEVGSLDWISGLLWCSVALLTLGLKVSACAEIGTVFRIKRYIIPFLFCLIVGILGGTVWDNQTKVLQMATSGIQYLVFLIELLIPFLCIFLLSFRKNRRFYAPQI